MSYIIGFIIIAFALFVIYKLIVPIIKFDPFKAVVEELERRNETSRKQHNCTGCSRYSTPFLTYYENDCLADELDKLNGKITKIMRYQRMSMANRRFRNKRKKKS